MKTLILLLLLSSPAVAAVVNTECVPQNLSVDEATWERLDCIIYTDDAGTFVVSVSSQTLPIRATADGSIRVADLPALRTEVQTQYRAQVVAYRAARTAEERREQKRRRALLILTPGQVE